MENFVCNIGARPASCYQMTMIKKPHPRENFDKQIALVLQGGGALGSYQAGVYAALDEADYHPTWIAGISIGAINAAIIAGNEPKRRLTQLRAFWELVSESSMSWPDLQLDPWRNMVRQAGALSALVFGQPGFFRPNTLQAWISGKPATSYYDTAELKSTLERLVDFDRINAGEIRLSVGAVNVRTGNFAYFDSANTKLRAEHIMASGALPPGFPAVEIDGERYWDGGLVSNTPLQYLLEATPRRSSLVFQVDLFPARGAIPEHLEAVEERRKDIQFSSRTRLGVDTFRKQHHIRHTISKLLKKLPPELQNEPEVQILRDEACQTRMDIVHIIYRPHDVQGPTKDFEFSRITMRDRWTRGQQDAQASVAGEPWLKPAAAGIGVRTFDAVRDKVTRSR